MLDHLSLPVASLVLSARFYDAVLFPLRVTRVWSTDSAIGYGTNGVDDKLAIKERADVHAASAGFHVALTARSRDEVDAFHAAALVSGGQDNGAPGYRPNYGEGYYAAFVIDPDGHRLEAVFHGPAA